MIKIINAAGVAAMNRCWKMAGVSATVAIHERYLSSMMAAELWEQMNATGTIKCDVLAEATYTEFYKRHNPNVSNEDVNQRHHGERIDVLISFPEVSADILIEVKRYDDGNDFGGIVNDIVKLRRVASISKQTKCYIAVYVTQVAIKPYMSLADRIKDLAQKVGCKVIAGTPQQAKSAEWEWCFATLEVSAVQLG